jgi:hypothetical protein
MMAFAFRRCVPEIVLTKQNGGVVVLLSRNSKLTEAFHQMPNTPALDIK